MKKTGIIYSVDLDNKMISLYEGNRLLFFYLQNYLLKRYKRYLYKGNLITFMASDEDIVKNKYTAKKIEYILEISVPRKYKNDILYSKSSLSGELKDFLNSLDNLLFLDIEMSMPPFSNQPRFVSEIIQAGYVLVNKNDEIIDKKSYFVLPTKNKYLTDRTKAFLKISYNDLLKDGEPYQEFYNQLKELIDAYHPAIVVFGKNDRLFLESSYKTNELPSLSNVSRFVNLNELLKNYYEFNYDPGLFKMYKRLYSCDLEPQKHNAYDDALVTYYVFKAFKDDVNNDRVLEKVLV